MRTKDGHRPAGVLGTLDKFRQASLALHAGLQMCSFLLARLVIQACPELTIVQMHTILLSG
jgi:hypothetical protein